VKRPALCKVPDLAIVEIVPNDKGEAPRVKDEGLLGIRDDDLERALHDELPDENELLFTSSNKRVLFYWLIETALFAIFVFLFTSLVSLVSVLIFPDESLSGVFLNFQIVSILSFVATIITVIVVLIGLFMTPRTSNISIVGERLLVLDKYLSRKIRVLCFPIFTWESIRISYLAEGKYEASEDAEKVMKETISSATNGQLLWLATSPDDTRNTMMFKLVQCDKMTKILTSLLDTAPTCSFYSMTNYYLTLGFTALGVLIFFFLVLLWISFSTSFFYLIICFPVLVSIKMIVIYCFINAYRKRRLVSVEVKFVLLPL